MLAKTPRCGTVRQFNAELRLASRCRPRKRQILVRAQAGSSDVVVAVAGGGIAGVAAGLALHKAGVPVLVLERAPGLRQQGSALALWSNAWRALDALGVGQQLRQDYLPLDRIELVSSSGKLLRGFRFSECGLTGDLAEMRGVRRAELLQAITDQLPPGALQFSTEIQHVSQMTDGRSQLHLADGRRVTCDVVVGADGAGSVVARHVGLPSTSYAGYVAYRGLATLPDGLQQLVPRNTIRQMFGAGVRAGMYPLTEQEVYWYICFNAAEGAPRPADAQGYAAEALSVVSGWATGIHAAVQHTDPSTISRGSIRDRWTAGAFGKGCVTLVGDAAHPMTPNLGQGGCTALEDGIVLARKLAPVLGSSSSSSGGSGGIGGGVDRAAVAAALREYESERSARCLPLTVRSYLMGAACQVPFAPVVAMRDAAIGKLNVAHFLDHTLYDCGRLPAGAVAVARG